MEQIGTIINYPKIEWSINYIIEQTYLDLISATACDGITRIYEQQVKWYSREHQYGIHLLSLLFSGNTCLKELNRNWQNYKKFPQNSGLCYEKVY